MNRNQASRRLPGAEPPTYAYGLSGRRAGRRRREENFAGSAGSAGWGHPDCRKDGGYDGDGGRGQDRDRADVAQAAAMLGTVVSFLFGGEGAGLRAESGAQQQNREQQFPAEFTLGRHAEDQYTGKEKRAR